jgi:hypothetical protein
MGYRTSSQTARRASRRRGRTGLRLAAAAAVLGVVAGCGGAPSGTATPAATASGSTGTVVRVASLVPGQAVPAPTGSATLTITGKISVTNRRDTLALDRETVEKMGVQQVRLYEPWTKETLDFQGVWLQHLLAVAGAAPEATTVHIVALDDYAVDLTMADIRAGGIMLATRSGDGTPIPIDKGGPTRIVFADGVTAGENPDQWVWSLKSIDVR